MTRLARSPARCLAPLAAAALVLATAACSPADGAAPSPSASASSTAGAVAGGGPTAVLAFAGDVHFEGTSASTTDLGSAFGVLADADLAVVNLETAVTTGGTQVDKQFAFRAPPEAMTALVDAGVDAVSIANNHGMDYGATGLQDTLEAGRDAHLPVLGAGDDVDEAFAPLRVEPKGVPVSVIAATDVIDSSVETAWTATDSQPGLASVKDEARLLADVRAEKADGRVVVVFLHWGQERVQCPTSRQTALAKALAKAGADVVVGSHAHVLEPTGEVGSGDARAFVAYGLGNFHFYAKAGNTLGTQTGVLALTVDAGGVVGSRWHPATIRSGRPELLSDTSLQGGSRSADELTALGERCASGGTPAPPAGAAPQASAGADDSAGDGGGDGTDDGADDGASPSASASAAPTTAGPEPSASSAPSASAAPSPTATASPPPAATATPSSSR